MQSKPVDPTQADKIKQAKVDPKAEDKENLRGKQIKKTEQVKKQEQATQPAKVAQNKKLKKDLNKL